MVKSFFWRLNAPNALGGSSGHQKTPLLNACQKWSPLMTGATSKCICGVQPPENDLITIFVCYFLHVRSSVNHHHHQHHHHHYHHQRHYHFITSILFYLPSWPLGASFTFSPRSLPTPSNMSASAFHSLTISAKHRVANNMDNILYGLLAVALRGQILCCGSWSQRGEVGSLLWSVTPFLQKKSANTATLEFSTNWKVP